MSSCKINERVFFLQKTPAQKKNHTNKMASSATIADGKRKRRAVTFVSPLSFSLAPPLAAQSSLTHGIAGRYVEADSDGSGSEAGGAPGTRPPGTRPPAKRPKFLFDGAELAQDPGVALSTCLRDFARRPQTLSATFKARVLALIAQAIEAADQDIIDAIQSVRGGPCAVLCRAVPCRAVLRQQPTFYCVCVLCCHALLCRRATGGKARLRRS